MALTFPFAAIVGQDEMTLAIQVVAIDPTVGGVLVLGDRGTGKSTAVRALAALLPPMTWPICYRPSRWFRAALTAVTRPNPPKRVRCAKPGTRKRKSPPNGKPWLWSICL